MSIFQGFASKEELLRFVDQAAVEKDGKFIVPEIVDVKNESDYRKTLLDKEIAAKKAFLKRAQEAEAKANESPAPSPSGSTAEIRLKDRKIVELNEELGRAKVELQKHRVYETLRQTAFEEGVPSAVYESEEFRDHVLARFTVDELTESIVAAGDYPISPRQFIAEKQKQNPLWKGEQPGKSPSPGRTRSTSSDALRAERFKQAEASGDILEMIKNAPLVDVPATGR